MATKDEVALKQVDMAALDEMDVAVQQAIGFMELVMRDVLNRYETNGTEYEKQTGFGIYMMQEATRKRLEKALEDLWDSAHQNSRRPSKAQPKAKRTKR